MRSLIFLVATLSLPVHAQSGDPPGCYEDNTYAMLDFWLGDWDVYVDGDLVGTNTIEKTLKGCAVIEHWQGAGGGRGQSLFYVDSQHHWQQVWVTERATVPGGIKEKSHQPLDDPRLVRFQGRIHAGDDGSYLDRTTLTDLGDGTVRQLIEVSMDEGTTWKPVFDATYRPAKTP